MAKNNGHEDVLKFDFQTIKLADISRLIPPSHRSKYSELCDQIIERVNSMPSDETFAFAPSKDMNGKLTEEKITSICVGVNHAFKRGELNWRLRYSEVGKAFVVAPYERHKRVNRKRQEIVMSSPQEPSGFKEPSSDRLKVLVDLTHKTFGITLRQLQDKTLSLTHPDVVDVKRAFLYVGRTGLGLKSSEIGDLLDLSSGSTAVLIQQAMSKPNAKELVKKLSEALNKN